VQHPMSLPAPPPPHAATATANAAATRPSLRSLDRRVSLSFSIDDFEQAITDGREGSVLKQMSRKLKDHKELTNEKVELIFEAFKMFPLTRDNKLTIEGLQSYYSQVDIILTHEQCAKMLSLFIGAPVTSVDFEEFALAYIRCEKTLPV
jgi:Ca2+-binding EF-hand superfamily protein